MVAYKQLHKKRMQRKKKQKKWVLLRHKIVTAVVKFFFVPYVKYKYRVRVPKFKEQGERQYLVLFNHQTAFDQFFISMAFKGAVYFVASEDLFSNGFSSSLIKYLVAPIPIRKQATDPRAVMNVLRVAKEGGTIALAPEGNRTYSGKTEYMNPALAPLIRKLNLPIALFRIEGGYGIHPRWSDVVRKGKMKGYVSRVIEPEEYKDWSAEELFKVIEKDLYVNEANTNASFEHEKLAEYLERALYVCPTCGLSTFRSENDRITCQKCGKIVQYMPDTSLCGVDCEFPFRFVNDWYDYQCDFINRLDVNCYNEAPMYEDTVRLSEVIPYKKKQLLEEEAHLALYGNRMQLSGKTIGEKVFSFDDVSAVTVLGKNKVNVYIDKHIYQYKGDKRFNALRYVNVYYRYKNMQKGENHEELTVDGGSCGTSGISTFLGL